jgi:carbamoyltransferase
MLLVSPVRKEIRKKLSKTEQNLFGINKLKQINSLLPAITHVDYSSRIQTVSARTNPRYHKLIMAFKKKTGCPLVINTSFNVRGEPIVCSPKDAYECFMRTEMDVLVMQNQLLLKMDQPQKKDNSEWQKEFELD